MVSLTEIDRLVRHLFALVNEAIGRATLALLDQNGRLGHSVVDDDRIIDELTLQIERSIWERIDQEPSDAGTLRRAVGVLLIAPELERSADLAEHIAQRSITGVGSEMTTISRGILRRMSEVALEMWNVAEDAYVDGAARGVELDEDDEELDILLGRLTIEASLGVMSAAVTAQVTLLARFYERLGAWCLSRNHPPDVDEVGSFESSEIEIGAYGASCAEVFLGALARARKTPVT